jgi:LPXTG-site transpeptidase (sortase) family protein
MRLLRTPGRRHIAAWAERSLWALGLSLLGYWGFSQAQIRFDQARLEESLFSHESSAASSDDDALSSELPGTAPASTAPLLPLGSPVALLEIPRVDVRAMVVEGVDDRALKTAAGHLPGTALPGAVGNSVVAAHRDTLFAGLRHVRIGDRITARTGQEEFTYRVSAIDIVTPRSVHVLEPTAYPSLTLITCFPFDFVGPAPMRYVVSAVRDGVDVERTSATASESLGGANAATARRTDGSGKPRPLDPRVLSFFSGSLVKPGTG